MSSGASGSDENISSAKIEPLGAEVKAGVPHAQSSGGVAGTDGSIDHTRIDPLGGRGQYQHPEPHADSQGVVGRDETIAGAKIDPLAGKNKQAETELPGLDDENVDSSRIPPMGEVREEMS